MSKVIKYIRLILVVFLFTNCELSAQVEYYFSILSDTTSNPPVPEPTYRIDTTYSIRINGVYGYWWEYSNPVIYGGAVGTAFEKIRPMAIYDATANKTFFAYSNSAHYACINYYDHTLQSFGTENQLQLLGWNGDPHGNPALVITTDGYIVVNCNSKSTTSYMFKSNSPRDISAFTQVTGIPYHTYSQLWQAESDSIISFYRHYNTGDGTFEVSYVKSHDYGVNWTARRPLITWGTDIAYSITYTEHTGTFPEPIHILWNAYHFTGDYRDNIYYAKSLDGGITWKKSDGTTLSLPINETNAELIYDSGILETGLNDIQTASDGTVYALFTVGDNYNFIYKLMKWESGLGWTEKTLPNTDQQFDMGCMWASGDTLDVLIPIIPQQENEDGGNLVWFTSNNKGDTWSDSVQVTNNIYNHNYLKTVYKGTNDFRAFWSYGNSTDFTEQPIFYYFTK